MNNRIIDIPRASGRKIVKELQNKKAVTLEYPLPEGIEKAPTHKEVFYKLSDDLSEDYGIENVLSY